MHITNGIVIQVKISNETTSNRRAPRNRIIERKRSFQALPNKVAQYKGKTRKEPTDISVSTDVDDEQIEMSGLIDFFWVLLRMKSSTVPSWKGFNYLTYPFEDEPVHEISYLPAINHSPTELNTVLELLTQSKTKSEILNLTETDVVVDQAIYAKACEVITFSIL